jgi:hypothetical protein
MAAVEEQHFILRVQDPELAGRLRGWLRESGKESDNIEDVRLLFESSASGPACTPVPHQQLPVSAAAFLFSSIAQHRALLPAALPACRKLILCAAQCSDWNCSCALLLLL